MGSASARLSLHQILHDELARPADASDVHDDARAEVGRLRSLLALTVTSSPDPAKLTSTRRTGTLPEEPTRPWDQPPAIRQAEQRKAQVSDLLRQAASSPAASPAASGPHIGSPCDSHHDTAMCSPSSAEQQQLAADLASSFAVATAADLAGTFAVPQELGLSKGGREVAGPVIRALRVLAGEPLRADDASTMELRVDAIDAAPLHRGRLALMYAEERRWLRSTRCGRRLRDPRYLEERRRTGAAARAVDAFYAARGDESEGGGGCGGGGGGGGGGSGVNAQSGGSSL